MPSIILGAAIGAVINVTMLGTTVTGAILISISVVVILGLLQELIK